MALAWLLALAWQRVGVATGVGVDAGFCIETGGGVVGGLITTGLEEREEGKRSGSGAETGGGVEVGEGAEIGGKREHHENISATKLGRAKRRCCHMDKAAKVEDFDRTQVVVFFVGASVST